MNTLDRDKGNHEIPTWNRIDTGLVAASATCFAGGFYYPALFGLSVAFASAEVIRSDSRKHARQMKNVTNLIESSAWIQEERMKAQKDNSK